MKLRTALLALLLADVAAGCSSKSESEPCVPDCTGMQCGWDPVCDQICGTCPSDETCEVETGRCLCVPDCADRFCGPDHCGGSCGTCQVWGEVCDLNGQCQADYPCCATRECGLDPCVGSSCGTCPVGEQCNAQGLCETLEVPCCGDRECGLDPCFGVETCGAGCPAGEQCDPDGQCVCVPDCAGRDCGTDGCGGSCGECESCDGEPAAYLCYGHQCMDPCCGDCGARECGPDPVCGTSCGTCPAATACNAEGQCLSTEQQSGDPCTFGLVHEEAGQCMAGLECVGFGPYPEEVPCPNGDSDCHGAFESWLNPDCVNGGCGASVCAAPCVDGWCEDCFYPFDLQGVCYCLPIGGSTGIEGPGHACPWDSVNAEPCYSSCQSGMVCLGMPADPVNLPCATGADCLAFYPGSWNVDCEGGGCGMSFCSGRCDADGQCPPGSGPSDVAGDCYCIPAASDTPRGAGEPCTFVMVNVLAGLCADGLACAGVLSEEGAAPCPNGDADCLAFYDAGWNPDCTNGRCGASFCAAPCVAGACEAGLTPVDVGGTCYCRASK